MKKSWLLIIMLLSGFLFSGCATRDASYSIAPVNTWVNPDRQGVTVRKIQENPSQVLTREEFFVNDVGEEVKCLLPGDTKPTIVFSDELCEQLKKARKVQINKKALRKVVGEPVTAGKRKVVVRQKTLLQILEEANRRQEICDELKFKDTKEWCHSCSNSLSDQLYCKMNGYRSRRSTTSIFRRRHYYHRRHYPNTPGSHREYCFHN